MGVYNIQVIVIDITKNMSYLLKNIIYTVMCCGVRVGIKLLRDRSTFNIDIKWGLRAINIKYGHTSQIY